VFFAMWVLGQCGGGDAKLFGALGGWLGWQAIIPLWIASVAVLIVWALAKLIGNGLRPGRVQSSIRKMQKAQEVSKDAAKAAGKKKPMRITYSLPIAVATLLTCLLYFSRELQLLPAAPPPVATETGTGTGTPDVSTPPTPSSK
jgi:Flp pilus assembly protein protease CpaA